MPTTLDLGDVAGALPLLIDHTIIALELDDRLALAVSACRMAAALALADEPMLAVELMASADVVQRELGSNIPWVAKDNAETAEIAHATLDPAAYADAWEVGSRTPIEEVSQRALEPAQKLTTAGLSARGARA